MARLMENISTIQVTRIKRGIGRREEKRGRDEKEVDRAKYGHGKEKESDRIVSEEGRDDGKKGIRRKQTEPVRIMGVQSFRRIMLHRSRREER